jgi:hypothetical protein
MSCRGEDGIETIHKSLFVVGQDYLGDGNIVAGEHVEQRLKSPFVVFFGFFMKESKGDTEQLVRPSYAGNVEEGHAILIRLVGAIEE